MTAELPHRRGSLESYSLSQAQGWTTLMLGDVASGMVGNLWSRPADTDDMTTLAPAGSRCEASQGPSASTSRLLSQRPTKQAG